MKNDITRFAVTIELNGEKCFLVPIGGKHSNGNEAIVDEAGLEVLKEVGGTLYFHDCGRGGSKRYLRMARSGVSGRSLTPARLIIKAGRRERVRYRNGNPADLRISNLRIETGFAKRCDIGLVRWQEDIIKPLDKDFPGNATGNAVRKSRRSC